MEIRELTTSYKMSLTISNGASQMNMASDIIAVEGDRLYVEPFMHNDVVLSFTSGNVSLSMIAYEDEKAPFLWKIVSVEKDTYDGKVCHAITSGLTGVRINRRENFRVFVGLDGKATLVGKNIQFDIVVKDISETGFAVLVDINAKVQINTNDALLVEFYDAVQEQQMTLLGRIVRGAVLEKYYLFGCRTLKDGGMSRRYISNKQLEKRINSMKRQ